jgi:hypothetical protein
VLSRRRSPREELLVSMPVANAPTKSSSPARFRSSCSKLFRYQVER